MTVPQLVMGRNKYLVSLPVMFTTPLLAIVRGLFMCPPLLQFKVAPPAAFTKAPPMSPPLQFTVAPGNICRLPEAPPPQLNTPLTM